MRRAALALFLTFVAVTVSACGTVVHSRALNFTPQDDRRSSGPLVATYQYYALPVSVITADFVKGQNNRWTVTIGSETQADPEPGSWFAVEHHAFALAGDHVNLTVQRNLLNTANNTSEPGGTQFVEAVGGFLTAVAGLNPPPPADDTATVSDLSAFLTPTYGSLPQSAVAQPSGERQTTARSTARIAVSFDVEVWASQLRCGLGRIAQNETTAPARPESNGNSNIPEACRVETGIAVAKYNLPCDLTPSASLPGELITTGACSGTPSRRTDTYRIGAVGMILDANDRSALRHFQSHPSDHPQHLSEAIARSYSNFSEAGDAPSGDPAHGLIYRVAAPIDFVVRFDCALDNGIGDAFRALRVRPATGRVDGSAVDLEYSFSPRNDPASFCGPGTLQQFSDVRSPVVTLDVVVEREAGYGLSVEMTRNAFTGRTTNFTFTNGVLTGVEVEGGTLLDGPFTLAAAILGVIAANND